jgi:hypothetical protein
MDHRYVRFARDDPETPPTMHEQVTLARQAARKLGIPNAESTPLYRVGRNSNTGESWGSRGVEVGGAAASDVRGAVDRRRGAPGDAGLLIGILREAKR